jgi:hypothetical protein
VKKQITEVLFLTLFFSNIKAEQCPPPPTVQLGDTGYNSRIFNRSQHIVYSSQEDSVHQFYQRIIYILRKKRRGT